MKERDNDKLSVRSNFSVNKFQPDFWRVLNNNKICTTAHRVSTEVKNIGLILGAGFETLHFYESRGLGQIRGSTGYGKSLRDLGLR